jgi:phosphohistidine phosphatase
VGARRLVLIRHAQASNAASDRDRPLSADGEAHATAIGAWLAEAGLEPDLVLLSPALRAQQTWERAAAALPSPSDAEVEDRIYDNTVDDLMAVIGDAPDHLATLAVVGHNPSVGEFAAALDDGKGDAAARDSLASGFPTGAVAVFSLAARFEDLAPETGTLTAFAVPQP